MRTLLCILWGLPTLATAHFQLLIPSTELVSEPTTLEFDIRFTHPMDGGPLMNMAPPVRFGVVVDGENRDLLSTLQPLLSGELTRYVARMPIDQPALYAFYLEPAPYFEPAEQKFITHYTKVIVDSMEAGEGWDRPLALPVEIVPLTRPFGLWTGSLFRGIVHHQSVPAPFVPVEIEFLNTRDLNLVAPAPAFVTQVVKTDAQGVFAATLPAPGWWGFAALVDGPERPGPDSQPVGHELGGLLWVRTRDVVRNAP